MEEDPPDSGKGLSAGGREGPTGSPAGVPGGSGEDRLVAARDFLAGKAGASAAEPWTPARWPLIRDQQIGWLKDWAAENGLWIPREALGNLERCRMEHDLFPEVEPGWRMWKVTRGAGFGRQPFCEEGLVSKMVSDWFQARPGTPLQYLERLVLVNERLFPGMNRLEGFIELDGRLEILTSQPWFRGRNVTGREIAAFFHDADFLKICRGTWFRDDDNLAIFDAGETNLIFSAGIPVPIDVIPIIATGHMLDKLREAANATRS